MKLLLDMNLSPALALALAEAAIDVRHWSAVGAPSVVQIRVDDISPKAIGRGVAQAVDATQDALLAGALVTVYPQRQRVRVLPLGSRNAVVDVL